MKVGFFDLDGTVSRYQQTVYFIQLLFSRGIYPMELKRKMDEAEAQWQNRTGDFSVFIHTVVEAFNQNIKGQNYDKFCELAQENAEMHWQQTYNFTRDLIEKFREAGYFLVLISHAPKLIVRPFAEKYGFNKVYGRFFELDESGNFTGKLLYEDMISDKAKIVDLVVKKYNLSLEGSIAVGDSEGDISMLAKVEHPLCMNPNSVLFAHAQSQGWRVAAERKGVSYVIPLNQEELRKNLLSYLLT